MFKKFILIGLIMAGCSLLHAQSPRDGWTLEYPDDDFSTDAMLDLSYLNEEMAGETGFVGLSPDGKDFVKGNGELIRFWAIGGAVLTRNLSDAELQHYARYLAKMGVNMIRFHGELFPKSGFDLTKPNMDEIDAIWRTVAAMKKEGIYTVISPYWPGFVENVPVFWDLGEYVGEGSPWALLFFDDKLKEAFKEWIGVLYTTENPYTGIALKDDPAVALIQIQNEDSLLFWTIQDVRPNLKATIEKRFFEWLEIKYGNITQAYDAWQGETVDGDDVSNGTIAIYLIWEATQPQTGGKAIRVNDQVEFLTKHQKDFYDEMYDYHRGLGCQQLINAGNWRPADPTLLFDAERWSNSGAEVMAVNRYYDPQHIGPEANWRIDPGHQFVGKSALLDPVQLPVNIKQHSGKPFIVPESGWNLPNQYQAEGPFLVAAYMSLTGVDGFFWFRPTSVGMDPSPYWDFVELPGGQNSIRRFTASTPGQIGMFPANALLFRQGYLRQGQVMVHEERMLESLWKREIPIISEESGFDPNRDTGQGSGNGIDTEVSPLAHLTGPIEVVYEGNPANNFISPDIDQLIDEENKMVTSVTGQLKWDYDKGLCIMDAPSAQGVAGFFGTTTTTQLSDVKITSSNDYAVVNVVAMDSRDLKDSEEILIQVGTVYRPTNWVQTEDTFEIEDEEVDGFRILNTGRMPWKGARVQVSVAITNARIQSAHLLDLNGYKRRELPVEINNGEATVNLPEDAMYIVLNTDSPNVVTGSTEKATGFYSVYPNPSTGKFVLAIPDNYPLNNIEVTDQAGRSLLREENVPPGQMDFSLAGLPDGLYYINISSNNQQYIHKIILHKQ